MPAMYAKSLTSAMELSIVRSKHDMIIFLLLRGFEANSVLLVTFGIIRAIGRFHFHATKNKSFCEKAKKLRYILYLRANKAYVDTLTCNKG